METYKRQIIELYNQGKTNREISRIVGCSSGTVTYHTQRKDIDEGTRLRGMKLKVEEIDKINLLYSEGNEIDEIGKITGYSPRSIKKYLISPLRKRETFTQSEITARHRRRLKQKLVEYKGGSCERCGYNKCIGALEFHHLDPSEKDFNIATTQWGFEKTKKEVDKCELLCSNCHREIHNCND